MSQGAKLAFFFAVSVALHGAGLWAAAERFQPRSADSPAEVAIVDRDLFFRHAARSEMQASQPVAAADRVAAVAGSAVRPAAGESVAPARAAPASGSEPERPRPVTADAAARPDLSAAQASPPDRRPAVQPQTGEAVQTRPLRMSSVAAAPPAAIPPQIEPSVDPAYAEPVRAVASVAALAPERIAPPTGPDTPPARQVERLARTAAEAPANPPAIPSPALAPEPGAAPSAERMAAAEGARLEPSSTWRPAGEAGRPAAPSPSTPQLAPLATPAPAPAQAPGETERPVAPEPVAALRGTMPPPTLAPREPESARTAGELAQLRPSLAAVPTREPVTEPVAAGTALLTPPRTPSTARPTPVARAAPREIAPPPPAPEASGVQPSNRPDPADRFTRSYRGGECFFPVPIAARNGALIAGYGLQAESVQIFRQAYAQAIGVEPDVDWRPITDSQCGGISFARIILGGSPPSVHIGLDRKEIGSGEELAGRVTGSRFEFVTLLLVDDAGLVHNVLDYLRPAASAVEFSFPVHPVDDGMDRVQLMMAVSASMPLAALNRTTAVHSDDFFPELLKQAREAGALLDLGLEDFVILDRPS